MKILNNFAVLANNYNYGKSDYKKSNLDFASHDTVSFTAKGPRGFKEVKKAVKKVVNNNTRNIKNSYSGEFSRETQLVVENIHENLNAISEFYEKMVRKNPNRLNALKHSFDSLVIQPKKQGLTFKMDDDRTLTILKNRKNPNLVRFLIEDGDKKSLIMLDGYDKVVKNVSANAPSFLPPKLRYMTVDDIEKADVKTYIYFVDEKLESFRKHLHETPLTPKAKTARIAQQVLTPQVSPLEKIVALFKAENPEIPSHLSPTVSANNSLLGVSMDLENGSKLKVLKQISATHGKDLCYLSFVETTPSGPKQYLSVDLLTGEILKTASNGRPVVKDGILYSYTPAELKQTSIKAKLAKYSEQLFRHVEGAEPQTAVVLKYKKAKAKAPDKINIEEIEDLKVSRQIEKEIQAEEVSNVKQVQHKKQIDTPIKQSTEKEITKEEPTQIQKLVQQATPQVDNAKIKANAVAQATEDAKLFAQTYFETFVEQVQQNLTAKMSEFNTKLGEFLQTFVKNS